MGDVGGAALVALVVACHTCADVWSRRDRLYCHAVLCCAGVKEAAAWTLGYIAGHNAELAQQVVDAGAVPLLVLCVQVRPEGWAGGEGAWRRRCR